MERTTDQVQHPHAIVGAATVQSVIDAIPHMVWVNFAASHQREFYNRRWREFTGVTLSPDGSTRRELIHPEDRDRALAAWLGSLESGDDYHAEYRLRHSSGEYRWVSSNGRPQRNPQGEIVCWYGTCTDVHQRVVARQAFDASDAINRSIIQASADCIKMLDLAGRIVFMNVAAIRELPAKTAQPLIGTSWIETLPSEAAPHARAALGAALKGGVGRFSSPRGAAGDQTRWRDFQVTPVLGAEGVPTSFVVVSRDVTCEKEAQERLSWAANHDPLTNLPNRSHFQHSFQAAIEVAHRSGASVGLLLLDVDHFKQVNDTLGHEAGDQVLCAFAERLSQAVRDEDVVGRLGGDEFAILLTGISGPGDLEAASEKIIKALHAPFSQGGRVFDCRGSIGASIYPQQGAHRSELMKQADAALYVAKASGRGRSVLFEARMRGQMQTRLSMLSLARDAIEQKRLSPFYQPKVDLASGKVVGFEALMRWRTHDGHIRLPAMISAAFQDSDLATRITKEIVASVLADMRRWLEDGLDFGHVAVNASAPDFQSGDFGKRLLEQLECASVPTARFHLEVTETVFIGRGAEYVERALRQLSSAGVQIALDDFGTGFASLAHLKKFPVDMIKIDRSFVRDLETDPEDAAIIRAVINLGKSLDIAVVAEGVETRPQEAFLAENGCDFAQGYLYGKAVPASAVPDLLSRRTVLAA